MLQASSQIELKDDAKPFFGKPYKLSQAHILTIKREVDRMVAQGTLRPVKEATWALPSFIIPKKNGTV